MKSELNIIFWNLNKKELDGLVAELIIENNVDILILAETTDEFVNNVILELMIRGRSYYSLEHLPNPSIKIITLFPQDNFSSVLEEKRYSFKKLISFDLYLCMVHMPSKLWSSNPDQDFNMRILKENIVKKLPNIPTSNIIIVGDFNQNPFESGIMNLDALFALPTPFEAKTTYKKQGISFFPFYNPMWQLMGLQNKAYGSYFYKSSQVNTSTSWHLFDQVIISEKLIDIFDNESLEYLTNIGEFNLLNKNGIPNRLYSDHLPLKFKLLGDVENDK